MRISLDNDPIYLSIAETAKTPDDLWRLSIRLDALAEFWTDLMDREKSFLAECKEADALDAATDEAKAESKKPKTARALSDAALLDIITDIKASAESRLSAVRELNERGYYTPQGFSEACQAIAPVQD